MSHKTHEPNSNALVAWACMVSLSILIGIVQIFALHGFYTIQHLVIIESKKCTNMAHELYAKYIVLYAELEVNISGVLREKYRKLDEANWNVEMNEMMDIFDALIRQMRQFMMDSFTRFEISRASR
eukprot:686916_1